jgi:hypothetical protein
MSPDTAAAVAPQTRLAQESVEALRRASLISIAMLAVGLATVAATSLYSVSRLRKLQEQVTAKQAEIQGTEAEAQRLADRKRALEDSVRTLEARAAQASAGLQQVATASSSPVAREAAQTAIETLNADQTVPVVRYTVPNRVPPPSADLSRAIAGLFSDQAPVRLRAYDAIMAKNAHDPALVPALLEYARAHRDNLNGIYNTLVVFSHLDRGFIAGYREPVLAFAAEVEGSGARIAERVRVLRRRMQPVASAG